MSKLVWNPEADKFEKAWINSEILLKCGDCGSTEVLTYPESNRDARKRRIR